jgi:PIN domain
MRPFSMRHLYAISSWNSRCRISTVPSGPMRFMGEWITAVLEKRPDLTRAQLERTRDLMNMHVRDALVLDFEPLIDVLQLPDPDDRHVLAAAIKGRANLIVTFNLKDFPGDKLDRWGIEAQHPDEFLMHQFHLSQPVFLQAVKDGALAIEEPAEIS